jgi:hypothetical protein
MSWPGISAKRVFAPDVPAIHVFACLSDHKDVDARHKAGHDGQKKAPAKPGPSISEHADNKNQRE